MNKRMIGVVVGLVLALLARPLVAHARYLNPDTGRFQTMDSYEGASQDPLSLHKYLYCHADPINAIDPSGHFMENGYIAWANSMALSPPSPSQWPKNRAILAILAVDGNNSVSQSMIAFYMNNHDSEATYMLTEQQMVECNIWTSDFNNWTYNNIKPGINIAKGMAFDESRKRLNGNNTVVISEMKLPLRAKQGKTLGLFTGYASGTLTGSPNAWSFSGTVRFYDYWDLLNKKRGDPNRNLQTWIGRKFINGQPFHVRSPQTPILQTSEESEGNWKGKGGFPTSEVADR